MNPLWPTAVLTLASLLAPAAQAQSQSRGELLYNTHCIACHTTQAHWRDRKLATDWRTLQAEVRRWQAIGQLRWNDDDVLAVTAYLNDRYYRYARPRETSAAPGPALARNR